MGRLVKITLRKLNLPLIRPYSLSYRTFASFEPFLVEVEDSCGRKGFADGHISPGSSSETREGGWAFLCDVIQKILSRSPETARAQVLKRFEESKVAATALVTAIEMLQDSPHLNVAEGIVLPLLAPVHSMEPAKISAEIEEALCQGFRTFKIKVGKDVNADLKRVADIQTAVAGRAALRLDANRGFHRDDAVRFATSLDPHDIELFEQPCDADDWSANAAVAACSNVPLMLDEPICTIDDIERAAAIPGVAYCKLKLKRFGGLQRLHEGLVAVRRNGMQPVLGDGLGSEVHSWLEACVAQSTTVLAGEFNGFLKARDRLFENPIPFREGAICLEAGYVPQLAKDAVTRATIESREFR